MLLYISEFTKHQSLKFKNQKFVWGFMCHCFVPFLFFHLQKFTNVMNIGTDILICVLEIRIPISENNQGVKAEWKTNEISITWTCLADK